QGHINTLFSSAGLCNNGKRRLVYNIKILGLVLNAILIISSIIIIIIIIRSTGLSGRSAVLPTALPSPSTPNECCPDGWIGYQRKCYYFSDSERNWTYSHNYCASFDASLVVIDSQEEMSFLRRYKGPHDHWIGLQRMDDQEPWKWIDGTIFKKWFEIRGGGTGAYLNHVGVASGTSGNDEHWICSKPVGLAVEVLVWPCFCNGLECVLLFKMPGLFVGPALCFYMTRMCAFL
ncbi:C-type lectin domain family 2 member D-like, partial [Podarcis raffonei]|uniref:C-type lectin domain family 2 member D-like n=1 Tax=Podarcis raffonei TaxID=65483 RepID=UPI00232940E1